MASNTWKQMEKAVKLKNQGLSAREAARQLGKKLKKSKRWLMLGIQAYEKFYAIKNLYPSLLFSHFVAVVTLDKKEGERLLKKAEKNSLSSRKLAREVRAIKNPGLKQRNIQLYEGEMLKEKGAIVLLTNDGTKISLSEVGNKLVGLKVRIEGFKE